MTHRAIAASVLVATGLLAGLVGCEPSDEVPALGPPAQMEVNESAAAGLVLKVEELPVIDGSEHTSPLSVQVASELVGCDTLWLFDDHLVKRLYPMRPQYAPTSSAPANDQANQLKSAIYTELTDRIAHHGTGRAYENLIAGRAELIFVDRKPTRSELADARRAGLELEAYPVARDALVFMVHRHNPVAGLSLRDVRKVYAGKVANWQDLGGWDGPVRTYVHADGTGAQGVMERLVLPAWQITKGAKVLRSEPGKKGPYHQLGQDVHGIGFGFHFAQQQMRKQWELKCLQIGGVKATDETIQTGEYPLTTYVYMVTPKGLSADAPAGRVRNWVMSFWGQQAVGKVGFVPIREGY